MRLLPFAAALLSAAVLASPASAQTAAWPNKPVKMIVPFAAGGTADLLARLLGARLSETYGQQFIAENRAGAGGNLGSGIAAKSAPDGYTLCVGTISSHAINPSLYATMPFDNVKDFAPVTLIAKQPNMLVVNEKLPVKTVPELIAYLKANPGKLNFASSGIGTSIHLAGEMFKQVTGTDMTHVPFKSSAEVMNAVISGEAQLAFDNMSSAWPQAQGGKVRALAVGTLTRSPAAPEVPTLAETLPGFETVSWHGLFAPTGTPDEIVNKLSAESRRILALPDVAKRLAELGADAAPMTPADFRAFVIAETERWRPVVKASGATVN